LIREAIMSHRLFKGRNFLRSSLLVLAVCVASRAFAAENNPAPAPSDENSARIVDVRPLVFDPTLLPAAQPTPALHSVLDNNDPHSTLIPLPPAAWTGMAGLVGLGLIRARRRVRRFFS
jgi:hypothetical protein